MRLCVNIDHVATLRNARGGSVPDPVAAAKIAEEAGADGIVCHLREDRRHIRDADVERLRKSLRTKLDLEMAAAPEIISIALRIRPDLVTLVPERRRELTTEGGLDVVRLRSSLRNTIGRFHDRGIPVSLFIDPVADQLNASLDCEADLIEIHTGAYAVAKSVARRNLLAKRISSFARSASALGLSVNAGHGLDYTNIRPIARMKSIDEVSIGHAIIVRAIDIGLGNAVREMVKRIRKFSS